VVCGRVESVCPDRIGTEGLEEGDVAAAVGRVGQGVEELGAARRSTSSGRLLLVRDALDEELRAILVEEFGALVAGLAEGAAICAGGGHRLTFMTMGGRAAADRCPRRNSSAQKTENRTANDCIVTRTKGDQQTRDDEIPSGAVPQRALGGEQATEQVMGVLLQAAFSQPYVFASYDTSNHL